MKTDEIVRYAGGLLRLVDVDGWKKWFARAKTLSGRKQAKNGW